MALSAAQVAGTAALVDQFAASAQQLEQASAQAAQSAWATFVAWYSGAAVTGMAAEVAGISQAAQETVAGLATEYVSQVAAVMTGTRPPSPPRRLVTPVRNGADPVLVQTRPAIAYRRAIALGKSHPEALNIAFGRAADVVSADITLQDRQAAQNMLDRMGITNYRRIIHPELSRTGTCGLCIVAADRVYNTGELMPLHPPSCKCTIMPIIGADDPGKTMNAIDIGAVYEAAGSTKADDLRMTRVQVNEHGEYGPVLTVESHDFRGPDKARLENDPERAGRMLTHAAPVLDAFESGEFPDGVDTDGALNFQRDFVARLTRITGNNAA